VASTDKSNNSLLSYWDICKEREYICVGDENTTEDDFLGYCTYHDRRVDSCTCRLHEDGTTCTDCQHLFTEFKNPMTVSEFARLKGVTESTVRRWIHAGKVKAQKFVIEAGAHPDYAYERYLIDADEPEAVPRMEALESRRRNPSAKL
jgi:hypothetical protein